MDYIITYTTFVVLVVLTAYSVDNKAYGAAIIYGMIGLVDIAAIHALWLRDILKKTK